jgi:FtsP/CotA-like multicopper oxidase with cupredoxin domain
VLIRFENHLDENPLNLDRQNFGSPDLSFLTHLHNGHTAPESDGNPHYSMKSGPRHEGYRPQQSVDNLYLNWPAGGDDREKQSFFWFHDHRMDQTGSNVYKGMVGLYPIYDPKNGTDMGDETKGLRLPGVRRNNSDGTFDVDYDVPLAFYDCRLDDGVTSHHDIHDAEYKDANGAAIPGNKTHPEWWGKTFFKHFPNHGFVGDIFTVNGTAYPTLEVKRRKYRFRFLDASVARIYEFKLMSSTQGPKAAKDLGYTDDELQGQYRLTDGQQSMQFTQIASDGGLVPFSFKRDSFELWPAKRREVVIDFTKYMDGSPTTKGDVVYLVNVMKMPTGRTWSNSSRFSPDPKYVVPVLKFVIGDNAPDASTVGDARDTTQRPLRSLPPLPSNWKTLLDNRLVFEVQRGSGGGETEWLINGKAFVPETVATSLKNPAGKTPLAQQKMGSFNLWEIRNGGGGWVHPFHLHMEEHRTVMRNGRDVSARNGSPGHPDDYSREDLVALDPSESVIVYRGFRDFTGPYVAHCHNLAHEDHAMMFGWEIT